MKIIATCMKCQFENLNLKSDDQVKSPLDYSNFIYLQINDENVYEFICTKGHKNALIHQEEKFELLFESAINAIIDGYLREAVSSIASSLERLYEFSIIVMLLKNKIQYDTIKNSWKNLNKQTERQLGAFIISYLFEFKDSPKLPSNKQVEFRNNVIHKGYFPTYDEVINYGQETLDIMFDILANIKSTCTEGIDILTRTRMIEMAKKAREITDLPPITITTPTIINLRLDSTSFKPTVLVEYIEDLKKRK